MSKTMKLLDNAKNQLINLLYPATNCTLAVRCPKPSSIKCLKNSLTAR